MARARSDDNVSETKDYLLRPFVSWRAPHGVTLDLGYDYLHSFIIELSLDTGDAPLLPWDPR